MPKRPELADTIPANGSLFPQGRNGKAAAAGAASLPIAAVLYYLFSCTTTNATQLQETKNDVRGIATNVEQVKEDLRELKHEEITQIKRDMRQVRETVVWMKSRMEDKDSR